MNYWNRNESNLRTARGPLRSIAPQVLTSSPGGGTSQGPVDLPKSVGNFELLTSFGLAQAPEIQVAKYMSVMTGVKVIHASTPGPLVNGYFCVPTEIWNSSGCPHTLEHLNFCGSHDFPFNGTMDLISNRLYGSTNAWTTTTDTTYNCTFGSGEGFLDTLPVYLDAILYPTLTQEAFDTEVYAINGQGEDSGVVFSEMQGRQGSLGDLMTRASCKLLYNKDNAYGSETGGELNALRKLTLQQIEHFHAYAYQPQNLTVIVVGSAVTPQDLLETLAKTEESIIAHGDARGPRPEGWIRPWVESKTARNPATITRNERSTVFYPSQDESTGTLVMNWIGAMSSDLLGSAALQLLGQYLSGLAIDPLQRAFTQGSNPVCASITISTGAGNPIILSCEADDVRIEELKGLDDKIDAVLEKVAMTGVNMGRMDSIIRATIDAAFSQVEVDPVSAIIDNAIQHALYGQEDGTDLEATMNDLVRLKILARWSSDDWVALLRRYFLKPSIRLYGTPSVKMAKETADAEKDVVAAHRAKLGPAGLHAQAKRLAASEKKNALRAPSAVIDQFPIPGVDSIKWLSVQTARSSGGQPKRKPFANPIQQLVDQDGDLPLFVQFDHLPGSHFIQISVVLQEDLAEEDLHLLDYLPTLVDTFFELPTVFRGSRLSYDETISALGNDTLVHSIAQAGESVVVSMRLDANKYELGIDWMNAVLFNSSFDPKRLVLSVSHAIAGLSEIGQDGDSVAALGMGLLTTGPDSTSRPFNPLVQRNILPELLARLQQDPDRVVADFERLKAALTNPCAMRIGVQADMLKIAHPIASWQKHFSLDAIERAGRSPLLPVVRSIDHISALGHSPSLKMNIFPLPAIESSFGYIVAAGPEGWSHPDNAPLRVACAMINATEGDLTLWNAVRGAGLAYGASVNHSSHYARVEMMIFKSPDADRAIEAAHKLIKKIADTPGLITADILQASLSQSSFAYIAENGSSLSDAADVSFSNLVLHNRPADAARVGMTATESVTAEDVRRAVRQYILPLFDPMTSIASLAAAPALAQQLGREFTQIGYQVSTIRVDGDGR